MNSVCVLTLTVNDYREFQRPFNGNPVSFGYPSVILRLSFGHAGTIEVLKNSARPFLMLFFCYGVLCKLSDSRESKNPKGKPGWGITLD